MIIVFYQKDRTVYAVHYGMSENSLDKSKLEWLFSGARLPCGVIFVPTKMIDFVERLCYYRDARETPSRRHFGAQMTETAGGLFFSCHDKDHPNPLPSPAP